MATGKKSGRTVLTMKESFTRVKNMDKELISGATEVLTLEDGSLTTLTVSGNISGPMVAAMKALGRTINSMDEELITGLMAEGMKENI